MVIVTVIVVVIVIIVIVIVIIIYFMFSVINFINLRNAIRTNTPVKWTARLCYRSPFTEIGAAQFLLLDRHVIQKDLRCLGQIGSVRCDLSTLNTPVTKK